MAERATQAADATQPAAPVLQAGAALVGLGPGNVQRARIRAIGLQRQPHKDLYHFVLAQSWPRFLEAAVIIMPAEHSSGNPTK